MTPEQAPKEVWIDFTTGEVTPFEHGDESEIHYIRVDRVELMVKLAVLEYKYDMWLSVHSAMDDDPILKEIQTIKEQLQ